MWTSGSLPGVAADVFRDDLGVPLVKGTEHEDVRPLVIGELLAALPARVSHTQLNKRVVKMFLASAQYGFGIRDGASVLVTEVKGEMLLGTGDILCATDVRNAIVGMTKCGGAGVSRAGSYLSAGRADRRNFGCDARRTAGFRLY